MTRRDLLAALVVPAWVARARAARPPDPDLRRVTRADFLTQTVPGYREGFTDYLHYDRDRRAAVRTGALMDGYTHVIFPIILERGAHLPSGYPTGDFLARPDLVAQAAGELYEDGLWPVLMVGFEDAPRAQKKHGFEGFEKGVRRIMAAVRPVVSKIIIGYEATEWIGRMLDVPKTHPKAFEQLHDLGRHLGRGNSDLTLGVHLSGELYGPPGAERAWLRQIRGWCDELYFQYGFGRSMTELRRTTERVFPRIRSAGVEPVPGEYSLRNNRETPQRLGEACVAGDVDGLGQFANGGPPYA